MQMLLEEGISEDAEEEEEDATGTAAAVNWGKTRMGITK